MASKSDPLFTQKLASSGITPTQSTKLGFGYLTAQQTKQLGHREIPALKIPYYSTGGKPTKFYRIRYLESTKKGFAKQTAAKEQRYDQPSGLAPEVYLPPAINWQEYLKGDKPLVITEGELKAACATLKGWPCIGLGGVWNFCSRKNGVALLPIFMDMNLTGRTVYIVFDSDAASNSQVVMAENELCRQLTQRGALPYIVRLPALGEAKKMGLDDYLLHPQGGEEQFEYLLTQATPFKLAKHLMQMNEEVLYIENPSLVIRRKDGYKMGVPTFKNEVYSDRTYIDISGEKPKKMNTAVEWMKWEGRAKVAGMDYKPGAEQLIYKNGNAFVNVWKPLPVEAVKGNVKPWHTLMEYIFADAPEMRRWFEQWLAYPLQHPGCKLFTAVGMWSVDTGTGKTLIGHTVQRIYGENSIMVGKDDIIDKDNSFVENKQFVLGEEITGDDKRSVADKLKSLITNEEIRINIKYVPKYSLMNCANYYFTSNNPDAFFLDEKDRRMFIWEVVGEKLAKAFYRGVYDPWYKSQEGINALYYYLMHLDLTGFDFADEAPSTGAKEEMIENSRSALANWVHDLRDNPERVLKVGNGTIDFDLYTTDDLLKLFDPEDKKRVGIRGIGVELKRARMVKAARGQGCRTVDGQPRLWAVRNPHKWARCSPSAAGEHYDKERELPEKQQKFKQKKKDTNS